MSIVCYLVSPRGFCSGVSRAVKMLDQVMKLYGTVYITEDIIHNKTFMQKTYESGLIKVSSVSEIPDNAVVMFSAHGSPPSVFEEAERKGLTIIDATCPIVKELHNAVTKSVEEQKKIIIIGKVSHPEVMGLVGHVPPNDVFVVSNELDIDLLPDLTEFDVAYFTQTTLDPETTEGIIKKLKKKIPHIGSSNGNNICTATKERQKAVREIAKITDMVLIVGSSYSSNSSKLVEVAINAGCQNSHLIESKNEIDLDWFNLINSFAISAGASAPDFVINETIEFIKSNLDISIENFNAS